jgi:uncharacterized membrane protein YoaT (DUF817 family)
MLYVQSQTSDDGRKNRPKHVECFPKIKQIWDIVHLVGFTIEIYYDARSYKRQNNYRSLLSQQLRIYIKFKLRQILSCWFCSVLRSSMKVSKKQKVWFKNMYDKAILKIEDLQLLGLWDQLFNENCSFWDMILHHCVIGSEVFRHTIGLIYKDRKVGEELNYWRWGHCVF